MSSWLFQITDTARDITNVVGDGDTIEDAEVDATAKWDAAMSGRPDYADRLPILACDCGGLTTTADPPSLII